MDSYPHHTMTPAKVVRKMDANNGGGGGAHKADDDDNDDPPLPPPVSDTDWSWARLPPTNGPTIPAPDSIAATTPKKAPASPGAAT